MVIDTIRESADMLDSLAQEGLKLADEATNNQPSSYEEIEMRKAMNMAKNVTKNTITSAAHSIADKWGSVNNWGSTKKTIEEERLC